MYKCIKIFLIILQLFGIVPAMSHLCNSIWSRSKKFWTVVQVLWILIISSGFIRVLVYHWITNKYSAVEKPMKTFQLLICTCISLQIMFGCHKTWSNYRNLLNDLIEVDMRLNDFEIQTSYKKLFIFLGKHLGILCFKTILGFILTCLTFMSKIGIASFVYNVPIFYCQLCLLQYYFILYAVMLRNIDVTTKLRHLLSYEFNPDLLVYKVQQLRLLNSKLLRITHNLNKMYGKFLVLLSLYVFIILSVEFYFLYK